jgi:hypothetical protein
VVEVPGGNALYRWARLQQPTAWRCSDLAGATIVEFIAPPRTDVSSRALSARIEVSPEALEVADLSLLVLLCGFLMVRGDGAPRLELEDTENKLGTRDLYGI